MNLKQIGEFGFIDRIRNGCLVRQHNVVKAIGDDACVFRTENGSVVILTTDMLVENVHFLRHAVPPFMLGRKAMAVNISDIAAMGGIPREAVISVAIPLDIEVEYLDALYDGMKDMAAQYEVNILGGNTTSEPNHLIINVALTGEAAEDELLYRSGAQAGDLVFLTGVVGSSAAGLDIVLAGRHFDQAQELLDAHFNPRPHIKEGRLIAKLKLVHSLIDVSDGVASDLGHICTESKVGAVIEIDSVPTSEGFRNYCQRFGLDWEHLALHVGEDYVLLGTAPKEAIPKVQKVLGDNNCACYVIGRITAEPGLRLQRGDGTLQEIQAVGYDHFRW